MWNKKTILTFSGPVKVANTTLPAGTYVFKLADSVANRNIVQIFDKDETHIYATILAMPAYRLEPADNTVIKFAETSASGDMTSGTLPADGLPIKQWFYPGEQYGQEFAIRPASLTTTTAVAETTEPAAEATPAPEPAPSTEQPAETAEAQPAPTPQPQTQAQEPAPQQPASQPESSSEPTPTSLPKTASPMPLIGLIGLLSLGAAAGLKLVANRRMYR
jgi:hypothetical protein